MRFGFGLFVVIISAILPAASVWAEPAAHPFVAGFERFARHREVSPQSAGAVLVSELSCTACHVAKNAELSPKRGPKLTGVGNRLSSEWIQEFLRSPQTQKPGTTMPDLFSEWKPQEKSKAIAALTAFLSTQQEAFPELKATGLHPIPFEFWAKGSVSRGEELYHHVGCVACHEAAQGFETASVKPSNLDQLLEQLSSEELREMGLLGKARRVASVPHGDLAKKYSKKSLTFFLLEPEKTRPAGRMPNMKLEPTEAADIAAYLLREQDTSGDRAQTAPTADLVEKGKELFVKLRCINCHEVKGLKEQRPAKTWAMLNVQASANCLDREAKGLPSYSLDKAQMDALRAVFQQGDEIGKVSAKMQLEQSLLKFNCLACHERDNLGGVGRFRKAYFETVGHVDIGDEGRLPPPLNGIGKKLSKTSLRNMLTGKTRVRPFLKARMPEYANQAKELANGFAEVDVGGSSAVTEAQVFGDLAGLAKPGRELVNQGCVECHSFRGESLSGTVGVDLSGATDRLHPQWFSQFLLNPIRLKPRTRMPTFFPNGESQNKKILKGDPHKQVAAIWAYLKDLDRQKLPEKIEIARSQNYELKPTDRPIVLRSFMKEAGTHAVAVGFPEQVHYAFDAESCRLAVAWKGRFLDAEGTWFSRFTPPAEPLGDDIKLFPEGPPFAELKNDQQTWPKTKATDSPFVFQGYRLDKEGIPTLLYRFGEVTIEDRIMPGKGNSLIRTLTFRSGQSQAKTLWFRPLVGKTVKPNKEGKSYTSDSGLSVTVESAIDSSGQIRREQGQSEWILPLSITNKTTIKVQYQW